MRLSNLNQSATQLIEHSVGLLTIFLAIHHLCERFPNGITVHVSQNSSATAYINSARPSNNTTNPSQLLLQISRQQKEKHPNLTVQVHPLSEANSNSPHHTQYSLIPTRNEVRTSSADTTIDCSTILHDLATH